MHKLLIAESLDTDILAQWNTPDIDVSYQPDITVAELEKELHHFHAVIVRPKEVTARAIENAPNLKLIIRGGAGVNSIDLRAAKANNIVVENTPGLNSDATAEFSFYCIMKLLGKRWAELSNDIIRHEEGIMPEDFMGTELKGKKLAIIGLGNVGSRLAAMASGFGMEVIAQTRSEKDSHVKQYRTMNEIWQEQPDVVSFHVPLTEDTHHMVNNTECTKIQKPVILINAARPALFEPQAIAGAVEEGKITHVAIDGDQPLLVPFYDILPEDKHILTHHIADATYEAQANITKQCLRQVEMFFSEGEILNRVA